MVILRWRYLDEFGALSALKANREYQRAYRSGPLAARRRGRMLEAFTELHRAAAAAPTSADRRRFMAKVVRSWTVRALDAWRLHVRWFKRGRVIAALGAASAPQAEQLALEAFGEWTGWARRARAPAVARRSALLQCFVELRQIVCHAVAVRCMSVAGARWRRRRALEPWGEAARVRVVGRQFERVLARRSVAAWWLLWSTALPGLRQARSRQRSLLARGHRVLTTFAWARCVVGWTVPPMLPAPLPLTARAPWQVARGSAHRSPAAWSGGRQSAGPRACMLAAVGAAPADGSGAVCPR